MTRPEFNKLLVLLQTYWSKCKRFREEKPVYALFMSLEPFPYERVRDQVVYLSRVSKYPPDPADILEPFAAEIREKHEAEKKEAKSHAWMAKYAKFDEKIEEVKNAPD